MSKICVCIEGQLRGAKNCGPTIKTHVIDPLNADLYFCLQNYEHHNNSNLKYYGSHKQSLVYENPQPDFSNTFNELCTIFNYETSKWKSNFDIINDANWSLGFSAPGTCIRRMFNRYIIYNMLKNLNYEWFIILRSDLYFVDTFYDILSFDNNTLYHYGDGCYGGINNNLIVFHKNIFDKVLTYIHNFLNLNLLNFYILNSDPSNRFGINEEIFFMCNMLISKIKTESIATKWFISADKGDISTWASIKQDSNGYLYKYDYDYNDIKHYLKKIGIYCHDTRNK